MPDALGSVRQLADEDGWVTLVQSFKPYGDVLSGDGEGESAYGYTGEWADAYIKLIYLRARYYAPETGRFLTRDTWPGDYTRPLSLNQWNYVEGNPVNHTDPTGQHWEYLGGAFNPRDLTDWLYREMKANLSDPVINSLRFQNAIDKDLMGFGAATFVFGCFVDAPLPVVKAVGGFAFAGGALIHIDALVEFRDQVKNGARWDFKDEIGIQLGPGITLCSSGPCYNDIEYSVPGNVFFAYVGRAAGFLGVEIQAGAAYAEWKDPAHDRDSEEWIGVEYQWQPSLGPTPWLPSTWNWGDEPRDHEAVSLGIRLWDRYGAGLTRGQFQSELAQSIGRIDRHPPDTEPVSEEYATQWPYGVGHFNNKGEVFQLWGDRQ